MTLNKIDEIRDEVQRIAFTRCNVCYPRSDIHAPCPWIIWRLGDWLRRERGIVDPE